MFEKKRDYVITAIATPFYYGTGFSTPIDRDTFGMLVKRQIDLGADGIVTAGTTGESPTLEHSEHDVLLNIALEKAKSAENFLVIAGTGSNSTKEAYRMTKSAKAMRADAALVVVPYYNKPSQEEIFRYFEDLNKIGIPLIAYDVPGRTVVGMNLDTTLRVLSLDNVIGLKDATGNIQHSMEVLSRMPEGKIHFSGNDNDTLKLRAYGCRGVVSVVTNIHPGIMRPIFGEGAKAQQWHEEYEQLMNAMFIESNPKPVKEAMYQLGITPNAVMRKPLIGMSEDNKRKLDQILRAYQTKLIL